MKKIILLILASLPFLTGCSTVGLGALNATSRLESGHDVVEDISYGKDAWQKLDVHTPKEKSSDDATITSKPVIVFFYGGAWTSGSKDQYYFAASAFTDLGYLVVVPDYVKYPTGKFPTFIHDGAKATAWTKKNIAKYGGNADQVFMVGHSAGAHLGALLLVDKQYLAKQGLQTNAVAGFAGMAGPYNFTPAEEPYTEIFGPEENFPKMKIMNFIDGTEPPMQLLHGSDDETVGILNKDSLIESIKEHGGRSGDVTYEGVSHVGILLTLHPTFIGDANAAEDIDVFFRSILEPEVPAE